MRKLLDTFDFSDSVTAYRLGQIMLASRSLIDATVHTRAQKAFFNGFIEMWKPIFNR